MGRDAHAMLLHYVMFVPTLQNQTDEEQQDEWLPKALSRGFYLFFRQYLNEVQKNQ
jgi:hypothetical protein